MKRLVIAFDGTWDSADSCNAETNVAILTRAIHATRHTDGILQVTLYLRGVGTTGLQADRLFDGATGLGVDDNIRSAYMFLAQNYVPGDEIFLFGFSRGAFSARSFAGLLNATGLLKRQSLAALSRAWHFYRADVAPRTPAAFLAANPGIDIHPDVTIRFLGVWDTVGSLGIPSPLRLRINRDLYGFHDTSPCPIVKEAWQALAIDEHRRSFVPTLWTGVVPPGCRIGQTWFVGAHSDVGGGYVQRRLADIPLRWMAEKAEAAGLCLDWSCLPPAGPDDCHAARHDSSRGVFAIAQLLPVLRMIGDRAIRLHGPQRWRTTIAGTEGAINETVHPSAIARFGHEGLLNRDDVGARNVTETYRPANLAAYLT